MGVIGVESVILLGAPTSSVSRSISMIRSKMYELESEVEFLRDIGFLRIEKDKLRFMSRNMDPKALLS